MFPLIRYYATEAEFEQFRETIKHVRCPHCGRVGALILHDMLYGYDEAEGGDRIVRGRRLFCSNRHHRRGCGRTVAIRPVGYLRGFIITAASLWRFLAGVTAGVPKGTAFRALGIRLHASSGWRLYRRVAEGQSRIRSFLSRYQALPNPPPARNPLVATLLHLRQFFPEHSCPIHAFHQTFQHTFL